MKLWSGRFKETVDYSLEKFLNSIEYDYRLALYDIKGSIAHVKMLGNTGIISQEDTNRIEQGLESILRDVLDGSVEWDISQEDIHMNIEKLLIDSIGEVGKKLHTARSRNDQVALDIRMYLKEEIKEIQILTKGLLMKLHEMATVNIDVILPGYTHLQRAQPISLAHHLLAYFEMFLRDYERFEDVYRRTDVLPLGSGALAGVPYPIDRELVRAELDFSDISRNSLDAVSDRDFAIDFLSASSILIMHLSRFCEELIFWTSQEYGFAVMSDKYSTGSSIMPQKKNPDVAELIRGKTGKIYGNLMSLLTTMKGLPLAYNKDMQEDKEPIFDTVDTMKGCLKAFTPMIASMEIRKDNMLKATKKGFLNATDLADYLVGKGIPFREAHRVVGELVYKCEKESITLQEIELEELKKHGPFEGDVYSAIDINACVNKKTSYGGTAISNIKEMIKIYNEILDKIL
jgi:argininosuccinate lyase